MADLTDIDAPRVILPYVPSPRAPTGAAALRAEMARTRLRLAGSISDVRTLASPSRLLSTAADAAREKAGTSTGGTGMAALAVAALVAAIVRRRLRRRALARSWPGRVMALLSGLVRPGSPWWGLAVAALTTYAKRR